MPKQNNIHNKFYGLHETSLCDWLTWKAEFGWTWQAGDK